MIKVIAFDFVGVLVREQDVGLSFIEDKIERLFGKNSSDIEFLNQAREYVADRNTLIEMTKSIIDRIYINRDNNIISILQEKYPEIKIVIATNHVSYVRKYIDKHFETDKLSNIFISAEINKVKPDADFYQHILDNMDIKPSELLFLDDNEENIIGANELGINTIKVTRETDIIKCVKNILIKR